MTTLGHKHLLHIDIETYSSNDIGFGVYKYSEADDFEIQLVSYALDNEPVHCIDLACGEEMPVWLRKALTDPDYQKIAHNASFERVCFSRWLGMDGFLDPAQWRCTMVMALMAGLPSSLKQVGEALDLEVQKDARGTVLINYFAKPCTPTKSNGMRTRNLPKHDPDKWAIYKEYNVRDVETEVEIYKALAKHPQPEWVWEQWFTDQRINDRGIKVDLDLVNAVRTYNEVHQEETLQKLKDLTGIVNPKSVQQVTAWLEEQGIIPDNLRSATVDSILEEIDGRPEFEVVAEALKLRSEASPTSVKKYDMAYNATGKDGRVRGSFQFYGAARTGRYSGRLVQLQNLKRNEYPELNEMRELIKAGQSEVLDSIYPSLSEIYGQLVRTMFIPSEHTFTVCDYSAIEARIQAWLAKETWVLEAFAAGKDIYCETASQMFGVPVEKHGVNGHLRQRGKVSVLACIAEGTPVATDRGYIPIEDVVPGDKVWDGEEWVSCDGAIYKGMMEVIEYKGLKATWNHRVYTTDGVEGTIQFGVAAACGKDLLRSEPNWSAIRLGDDHQRREAKPDEDQERLQSGVRTDEMRGMRMHPMDIPVESEERSVERLSELLCSTGEARCAEVAIQKSDCGKAKMHESKGQGVRSLRRERDRIQIRLGNGLRRVLHDLAELLQRDGDRQDRHERSLRSRKYQTCDERRERCESPHHDTNEVRPEVLAVLQNENEAVSSGRADQGRDHRESETGGQGKAQELERHPGAVRVYDILNAGRHHRYAVSTQNYIVHNCGYAGGAGAMAAMDIGHKIDPEEYPTLIKKWRSANSHIVEYWSTVGDAFASAINGNDVTIYPGIRFWRDGDWVFITLPSGRHLSYYKPQMKGDGWKQEMSYMSLETGKWVRVRTHKGKVFENICQAIGRDALAAAIDRLEANGFPVVMHVHDEVIVDRDCSVEDVQRIMSEELPWAKGLALPAAGYNCPYYIKD